MLVKVKTTTGRELEFEVGEKDKVGTLKKSIEEKLGISSLQQKLLFNGKPMNDEQTFKDQNVQAGSIIHLVLALRGGN